MTEETADKSVEKLATELYPKGRYPLGKPSVAVPVAANEDPFPEDTDDLMADIVARANLMKAYQRVRRNKGAPGVDGVSVQALKAQLQAHWPRIKAELLRGEYQPQPVRAVTIPKPGGGTRTLGIPTVMDRLIQQAIHQVLSALYNPTFSTHSYGFRPGRNAGQAVQRLKGKLKALFRRGRGQHLRKFIDQINPVIRGWLNYYRHTQVTGILQELDGWIRRHLRKILWRQWKRVFARATMLIRLGLDEKRAWISATNGRGPWWNAGASHMNQALPKRRFDQLGLVSLVDQYRRLRSTT